MTRYAVEITKFAIGDANVGGVYITVDLPGYFSMGYLFFTKGICYKHQIGQSSIFK
jgi:hypothetical protein